MVTKQKRALKNNADVFFESVMRNRFPRFDFSKFNKPVVSIPKAATTKAKGPTWRSSENKSNNATSSTYQIRRGPKGSWTQFNQQPHSGDLKALKQIRLGLANHSQLRRGSEVFGDSTRVTRKAQRTVRRFADDNQPTLWSLSDERKAPALFSFC